MEREGRWKGDDWRPKNWSERLDWELPVPKDTKKEKSSTKTVLKKKAFGNKKKKTELWEKIAILGDKYAAYAI